MVTEESLNQGPIIQAVQLGYQVGRRNLLKEINWTVNKGEHWVVFGMNGSGKTTLLSIVAGFNNYSRGELTVFGQQYTRENILQLRRRIGWVSSSFFDKCLRAEAVLDIVLSGLSGTLGVCGRVTDQQVLKAKRLLAELRLGHKVNAAFDTLSKGERQNVLIARALIAEPEILVLDEPGTGLDVFAREYLLNTVRELAEETEMTIIYVTHYTEEILDVFEHCLLLQAGRIYAQGKTENLFTESTLTKLLEHPVQLSRWQDRYLLKMQVESRIWQMMGRQQEEVRRG